MPDDFTPTSGVSFKPGGGFRIGMEAFFNTPHGSPNIIRKDFPLPPGLTSLRISGGSAALRPPPPQHRRFRRPIVFPTDALFRATLLAVDRDADFWMISINLKATEHPFGIAVTDIISPSRADWTDLRIEFQQAGAAVPANLELAGVGRWAVA